MTRSQILRILDANFNRTREGLRVCEEIARFCLNDKALTAALKKVRHQVSQSIQKVPSTLPELLKSRDVRSDVGKKRSHLERSRESSLGLFLANVQRVKESLRVLEETSKFLDDKLWVLFKNLRFKVYAIEKKIVPKLEAVRHHGSGGKTKKTT